MTRELRDQKGFTLMEMMVLILILGLLAAYAVPKYLASIETSKLGMVIANYDAVVTETNAAYYAPGSTAATTEALVVSKNSGVLGNPFTGASVIINTGTVVGGVIKVDGTTAGQVTVTAYDNSSTPASIKTTTISDP